MTEPLVARTTRMDADEDLLAHYDVDEPGFFFEHPRGGVVARGEAVRVVVRAGQDQVERASDEAQRMFDRIRSDGGPPPVLVAALPFDGSSPATLIVPSVAVVRRGREVWSIAFDARTSSPSVRDVDPPTHRALSLTHVPEPSAYVDAVAIARKRIAAGDLRKVVLARMLMARSDLPFDRRAILARLRETEPDAYRFAAHGFVGASPELLVSRFGDAVRAAAVAGTAARARDANADERARRSLLASAKDRGEHAFVVEAVRAAVAAACEEVDVEEAPVTIGTSAAWHLSTEVRGRLRSTSSESALALASRLHPTPAVCGTPPDVAMRVIHELERIDRTYYAGIVGWVDAAGDGEWAVALRCAEVHGRIALLFAGAGIVADSDPEAELAETDLKLSSMLDALRHV